MQEPLKLPWAKVNSSQFCQTLIHVNNTSGLEAKTAYRISRVFEACKAICQDIYAKEMVLAKAHCILDDSGQPLLDKKGEPDIDPLKKDLFNAAYHAICPKEIEIKVKKIDFNELVPAKLTGAQLNEISCLLDNLPE